MLSSHMNKVALQFLQYFISCTSMFDTLEAMVTLHAGPHVCHRHMVYEENFHEQISRNGNSSRCIEVIVEGRLRAGIRFRTFCHSGLNLC